MRKFLLIILTISFFKSYGQSPLKLLIKKVSSHAPTTIAFVSSADGGNNSGSSTSLTFSFTVSGGSDRFLVVGVIGDALTGNDDVTSVTYNGISMARANTTGNFSGRYCYLYYLSNPNTGANNVVISAGSTHYLLAGASEYTGVQGLDNGTTNASPGNATTLATSLTTVANNCWTIILEDGYNGGPNPTAGTGSTLRSYDGANGTWGLFDSNSAITPAGSYSMTTNRSSLDQGIAHCMISIKPY